MNKDQVKGTGEKVKGKVTGDKAQQVTGKVLQGAGEAETEYGVPGSG